MRADVQQALDALRQGELIGLPTETVYGLGADASNELAVRRIFAVKGRPSNHPLIVHVASAERAKAWAASWSAVAEQLASAFWPGPLTLIVERSALATDAVTGGQDTVGLRVPAHPLAIELLEAFGGGVAAPSANRFGRVSPTTAAHVREELGSEVAVVLDGGACSVGVESTIVDLSRGGLRVLRPGGVSLERLEAVLGRAVPVVGKDAGIRAPGVLESHYAPTAGLVLTDEAEALNEVARQQARGLKVGLIAPGSVQAPVNVLSLLVPGDAEGFARELYSSLRAADSAGIEVIVAVKPPSTGVGLAVNDRLKKAAHPIRS